MIENLLTVDPSQPQILDDISTRTSEVTELFNQLPLQSSLGSMVMAIQMTNGTGEEALVRARQESIEEIGQNATLRETIEAAMGDVAKYEEWTDGFFDFDRYPGTGNFRHTQQFGKSMRELTAATLSGEAAPETTYLQGALNNLREFGSTELGKRMSQKLYYTVRGVRAKEDVHVWTPRLRVRPVFSGRLGAITAMDVYAARHNLEPVSPAVFAIVGMMSLYLTMPIGPRRDSMKDMLFNYPSVYRKMQQTAEGSPIFYSAMHDIGDLDGLVSLSNWQAQVAKHHQVVFPTIEDGEPYHFAAKGLKNPVLAHRAWEGVVPNDIELGGDGDNLTLLTGPNSGGKSTISKAIVQSQVLAQLGAPIVAYNASLTLADRIAYHVPTPPDLEEQTGRFGFELKRVRGILDNASSRSLTVLDDCLDGTTHEERVVILRNVMDLFRHLGGATLFSTHAHELVEQFGDEGVGQLLQVEFANERPTYRLRPGISHTSHAERVAAKYGFSTEQVAQVLADLEEKA